MRPILFCILLLPLLSTCQTPAPDPDYVKHHYDKTEVMIPMRDGKRLFTAIYAPKDHSHPWPFLMERSPYSSGPYGDTLYKRGLGPSGRLMRGGFIFVYQDVRGRYMSEGEFQEMTPAKDHTQNSKETDESTD